jgi:DNA-binding XRE family transcriptional regulator
MVRRRARWRAGENADPSRPPTPDSRLPSWDASGVRALRRHLGLTQVELAQELGTRQATISEWEHGLYQPRGTSARMLGLLAERAGFAYQAGAETDKPREDE